MKAKVLLIAGVAALFCSCQQQKPADKDKIDGDQNFQERRQQMQPQKPKGGCCEAPKVESVTSQTAESTEVKVEKAE